MPALALLNGLPAEEARKELLRCCGSQAWARAMTAARPFAGPEKFFETAERIWRGLGPDDWREAFRHHPRIGDAGALRERFKTTGAWAGEEQSGVRGAHEEVLKALAEGNTAYEARFGHVFLVCATGKTAEEMLKLLQSRMGNSPDKELLVAAEEQGKITRIRLEKWLRS